MKLMTALATGLLLAASARSEEGLPHELTQAGINETAAQRLESAEREMNSVFESLVARADASGVTLEKLRQAQAAWQAYRDAQLAAWWPFPERGLYGTVYPMCLGDMKAKLTRARSRELRSMLDSAEGDVCASRWPR